MLVSFWFFGCAVRSGLFHQDRQFSLQLFSVAMSAPEAIPQVLLPRHSQHAGVVQLAIFLSGRPDSSNRRQVRKAPTTNMGYWRTIAASTQGSFNNASSCMNWCSLADHPRRNRHRDWCAVRTAARCELGLLASVKSVEAGGARVLVVGDA